LRIEATVNCSRVIKILEIIPGMISSLRSITSSGICNLRSEIPYITIGDLKSLFLIRQGDYHFCGNEDGEI
jgi:hypothetical protein